MTYARRVGNVLTGLIMLIGGLIMFLIPDSTYKLVILILGLALLVSGIRQLAYYISMARHMVGGMSVLYRSIIILDLALFTLSLNDVPLIVVVLYLAAIHGFAGLIDVMRAVESKRYEASSWKLKMSQGMINLIVAALCLAFLGDVGVAVEIYALGLMYSAVMRIVQAFRRTAIVYIQ